MSDINQVCLTGRLTRDPELRSTTSGTSVANTAIAVEGYKKDAEEQPVNFVDLTIWGNFAELVAKKARKGVTVAGQLRQEKWETESGDKRSKIVVTVGSMTGEFMYRKADGSDTPQATLQDAPASGDSAVAATPKAQDDDIPF